MQSLQLVTTKNNSLQPITPEQSTAIHSPAQRFQKLQLTPPPPINSLKEIPRYLLCNEVGTETILENLESRTECHGGMHVGFALWMNLDIISVTKPIFSLIADIDPAMVAGLELVKRSVIRSPNPEAFIRDLTHSLKNQLPTNELFFLLGADAAMYNGTDYFIENLPRTGWLASNERYNTVRQRYAEGQIRHTIANITDPRYFEEIKDWSNTQNIAIRTVYTSNIGEWLKQSGQSSAVSPILRDGTAYIDAHSKYALGSGALSQRLTWLDGDTPPEIQYDRAPRKRQKLN